MLPARLITCSLQSSRKARPEALQKLPAPVFGSFDGLGCQRYRAITANLAATLAMTLRGVPPPESSGFGMKRTPKRDALDRGVPPPLSSGFGMKRAPKRATLDRGVPPPLSSGFGIA